MQAMVMTRTRVVLPRPGEEAGTGDDTGRLQGESEGRRVGGGYFFSGQLPITVPAGACVQTWGFSRLCFGPAGSYWYGLPQGSVSASAATITLPPALGCGWVSSWSVCGKLPSLFR